MTDGSRDREGGFEGKVVVVTGAAGQIGAACAEAFVREGARVAGIDRVEPAAPAGAFSITADLSDPTDLEAAVCPRQWTDLKLVEVRQRGVLECPAGIVV